MARLWQSGFELNSATANIEWDVVGTGQTITTSNVNAGTYAGRISGMTSATPSGFLYKFASAIAAGPYFLRVNFRVHTLPTAANHIISLNGASTAVGTTPRVKIKLNSTGTLAVLNSGGTTIGTSSALSVDTWYRIEVQFSANGAGADTIEAKLNGSVFGTSSTQTNSKVLALSVGGNMDSEAQTTGDWQFDDIAFNDSTGSAQTSYPGAGNIVHLHPAGAGDNTQQTIGGSSPAATNWQSVNEVTPDDAVTLVFSNNTSLIDDYTVSAAPTVGIVSVVAIGVRGEGSGLGAGTITPRLKAVSAGTVSSGTGITATSGGYITNASASPKNYPLVSYTSPTSGSAWTQTDLANMQIGISSTGNNPKEALTSTLWASIDYMLPVATSEGDIAIPFPLSPSHPEPILAPMSFEIPYSSAVVVNASISQTAATITATGGLQAVAIIQDTSIAQVGANMIASGGTQVIATVNYVAISQVAATLTATGGTQAVATINDVSISQLAATVTASGGTQSITTVNYVTISQIAANITASGGVQTVATVQDSALTQSAASITATGGLQTVAGIVVASVSVTQIAATLTATGGVQTVIGAIDISINQVTATVTATGGVQVIATIQTIAISQTAATITASGGVQTILTINNASISQVGANLTASGGTQAVATSNYVALSQIAANLITTGGTQVIVGENIVSVTQVGANITATGGTQDVTVSGLVDAAITQIAVSLTATTGTPVITTSTGPLPPKRSDSLILLIDGQLALRLGGNIYLPL